jgi:uncharacterized protein (TIGR03083 family)
MDKSQIWPTIRQERQALADDLAKVSDADMAKPSLCEGWTVKDVVAHMAATAYVTKASFLPKMIGSGFSLTKMQNKDIAAIHAAGTMDKFKAAIPLTTSPPGPVDTWLGETLIHGEDIRRVLGIKHDYPLDALKRVADATKKSNLVLGAKKRIAGVKLVATDSDWSTGDGPEARGPMLSLVRVMSGRKSALDDLEGDGVAILRSRD